MLEIHLGTITNAHTKADIHTDVEIDVDIGIGMGMEMDMDIPNK